MEYKIINHTTGTDSVYTNDRIADFLFEHLDQYGDLKKDILKAIEYIFDPIRGGLVLLGLIDEKIVGAVVINETGMSGYIPENILVYIAVHKEHRGEGVGKLLMNKVIETAKGNIALHVEPDNPAVHLYEKIGFASKYLEMRLEKN